MILTLRLGHLLEVKRWVLSHGAACEVLEPEELRQEIRQDLEKMSNSYHLPGITHDEDASLSPNREKRTGLRGARGRAPTPEGG